jgi:hypothetical protein
MENLIAILSKPDNIPIVILFLSVPLVTWIAFREAARNDAAIGAGRSPTEAVLGPEAALPEKLAVWPFLLRAEFLSAILCTVVLLVWSVALNAPLEEPANANITPNPSKAPWYFLGLQELLVYFDPWIAGVVLPNVIVVGLMVIPYMDINPKGNGYYTWNERKFAVSVFCFGFLVMWVSLIIIGTFIRGPGWMWFWPWNHWDHNKVIAEVNIDLADFLTGGRIPSTSFGGVLIGSACIGAWFVAWIVGPFAAMKARKSEVLEKLGLARYLTVAVLFGSMMFVVLKIILRLVFSIKYILVIDAFGINI